MVSPRIIAKIESEEPTLRLAVLIDADNAQAAVIDGLLKEVASLGEATVKRIYGDFTSPASAQWKKVLNKYAIKPVQQFFNLQKKRFSDRSHKYYRCPSCKQMVRLPKGKGKIIVTCPSCHQKFEKRT